MGQGAPMPRIYSAKFPVDLRQNLLRERVSASPTPPVSAGLTGGRVVVQNCYLLLDTYIAAWSNWHSGIRGIARTHLVVVDDSTRRLLPDLDAELIDAAATGN